VTVAKNDTHRALLLMIAAATMFGGMAFTAKVATARLGGPEVAVLRMGVGLLPCLLVPRYRRAALQYNRLGLILLRGFFGGLAVMLYFIAIQHINVGVATLLNYTAPIWSGTFSMLFIGERFSARVLLPLPIALAGIFLVVHAHAAPGDVLGFGRWELAGALSAVASGVAVTAIRVARRSENSWSVYASFCLLGMFVSMPLGIAQWKAPTGSEWAWILATAFLAMGAQLLMTFSLRWVDAMTVGVISQLAVLVSMTLGVLLLGDHISLTSAIGSILCIGGVAGVTYVTSLSKPSVAATEIAPEA
jgi:drug/metabolite transporter (DMT)-like permease